MSKTNIYVLRLINSKYYVGKSINIEKRFQVHLSGAGSFWTKIHKPIEIEKIILNASPYDEDRYTKEYMGIYGIDNVRGGSYVTKELDKNQIALLQKEIWGAQNLCFKCGGNHFVKDCYVDTTVNGRKNKKILSSSVSPTLKLETIPQVIKPQITSLQIIKPQVTIPTKIYSFLMNYFN